VSGAHDKETFLGRWSRLKREEEAKAEAPPTAPAPAATEEVAPPLPPLESLTPQADFSVFMHPKVQDSLRRVALKKLFSDPHFNVMDLNEAYSGDWTGGEPITQEMLAQLNQARTLLFSDEERKKVQEQEARAAAQQAGEPPAPPAASDVAHEAKEEKPDEPGRQDA
jgi:hypothetical protein